MKLKFTNHAQYRIRERDISIEWLKEAINNPDYHKKSFGDKITVRKKFTKVTLEVVYFKDKNEFVVVTAYYI